MPPSTPPSVRIRGDEFAIDLHASVITAAAGIGRRLSLPYAALLDTDLVVTGESLAVLRRELREVAAFADAAARTGWVLGSYMAAPGEEPELVAVAGDARLWAEEAGGFWLQAGAGPRRRVERTRQDGWSPAERELLGRAEDGAGEATARRAPLTVLLAPLSAAAQQARTCLRLTRLS
ncbi:hypothetical protein [Bailinhaonella thermotolerans]|uniref:Uncharacterized protein n=1 Tax=Bailinhaonella thermotolerans TaxID=1070861 RepID=A0A3A4A1V5_9ACTN|nr:hypothetical protein [Bailinhaonella thermotolerans]RJL21218.1 hypothetical protein D5H75_37770 [Bailinhaonella thermotolerans]